MPIREKIMESLNTIPVPCVMRSLVEMNLVRGVTVNDHTADIKLASSCLSAEAREWLNTSIKELQGKIDGINTINVSYEDVKPYRKTNFCFTEE